MNGEGEMLAAVVKTAFLDACGPQHPKDKPPPREREASSHGASTNEIEAWQFLTDTSGAWAESRRNICWACGVDPDIVREEAIRRGPTRRLRAWLAKRKAKAEEAARDA